MKSEYSSYLGFYEGFQAVSLPMVIASSLTNISDKVPEDKGPSIRQPWEPSIADFGGDMGVGDRLSDPYCALSTK